MKNDAIQLAAIETVLQNGAEEGVFSVEHPKVETAVLRDMVRSVMIHAKGMSVEAMVDTIMRIFLQGVRKTALSDARTIYVYYRT